MCHHGNQLCRNTSSKDCLLKNVHGHGFSVFRICRGSCKIHETKECDHPQLQLVPRKPTMLQYPRRRANTAVLADPLQAVGWLQSVPPPLQQRQLVPQVLPVMPPVLPRMPIVHGLRHEAPARDRGPVVPAPAVILLVAQTVHPAAWTAREETGQQAGRTRDRGMGQREHLPWRLHSPLLV